MELEHVLKALNDVLAEQERELSYYRNCAEVSHKREIEKKDEIIKKQLSEIREQSEAIKERDARIAELESQLSASGAVERVCRHEIV